MELASLKSYQRTIASVELPLKHFIETGFWNPNVIGAFDWNTDIADTWMRRAARNLARELKRPFIECHEQWSTSYRDPSTFQWVELAEPSFRYGYISMPKQKRLINLVSPLLLASSESTVNRYNLLSAPVHMISLATRWTFRVTDKALWDNYYTFVLNDPDCRKARRLPS